MSKDKSRPKRVKALSTSSMVMFSANPLSAYWNGVLARPIRVPDRPTPRRAGTKNKGRGK